MARRESVAVAGYFPTPPSVVGLILNLLVLPEPPTPRPGYHSYNNQTRVLVDPCAGEGAALAAVAEAIPGQTSLFMVEMEETRAAECSRRRHTIHMRHGDFFLLQSDKGFASLLWHNPPYDHDREFKRLEERFLQRAGPLLAPDGLLIHIVPGYSLAASAESLARDYSDLQCWRFPDGQFEIFSQVVVIGRRNPRPFADPAEIERIREWSVNYANLPPLPSEPDRQYAIPVSSRTLPTWEMSSIDLEVLKKQFHPWESDRGEIRDICPPIDLAAQFHRVFPVASMPRATHLAAALATGVFNGARVEPDDSTSGLPPLLVKGVFDKEFRTVEVKHNDLGEKVAEVQVQHPVLQVTVLDINTGRFHTIKPSAEMPLVSSVEGMTLANLLDTYGLSLMRAMRDACPVLHDPKRDPEIEITSLAQPLFAAQKTVVNTLLRMVREQNREGAIVLGEIGSGKTRVALATAAELKARRVLVLCPPHLLDTWRNETNTVLPQYDVLVLDSISDAERFATSERPTIGVLSREKAKLGHGWRGLSGACPSCGADLPVADYAAKRERCTQPIFRPKNDAASLLLRHIRDIARMYPSHSIVRTLIGWTKHGERITDARREPPEWNGVPAHVAEAFMTLIHDRRVASWLAWTVPTLAKQIAETRVDQAWDADGFNRGLLLSVPLGTPVEIKPPEHSYGYNQHNATVEWTKHYNFLHGLEGGVGSYGWQDYKEGCYQGVKPGSRRAFGRLLDAVVSLAEFGRKACGAPLYQAVGEPRRYPIASWLCHRRRDSYDVLVVDECHEFSSEDSAQSHAKERLEQNRRAIRIELTGSLSNGYADSVYNNLYAISDQFRQQFGREGRTRFVDRYGYWKQVVTEKASDGKVIAFGSQSDRVTRTARRAGMAPGILPLFNLEWLLPNAATLQKEDLHLDLPQPEDSTSTVPMLPEQLRNYKHLLDVLLREIKETRFEQDKGGKLWGALAHLPSYLDLACSGDYSIRWPENVPGCGGQEIVTVPCMNPGITLPKEEWMLSQIARELDQDRPVLVLAWHRNVLTRLLTVLHRAGWTDAIYLDAQEVPTKKRQAWIDRHVVKAERRVMVVNPVTIQTGLNNLVWFKNQIWMENPGCNPHIYRQARGRIDRIGQTRTPRFTFPMYEPSMQEQAHKLLLHKVGVALGVDGLDPEAALRAAGVENDEYQGLSVGRALYRLLTGE